MAQAKDKKELFKLFNMLFKHFYFLCLHNMMKERKVNVSDFFSNFFFYFQNLNPRDFFSFWYIRQRVKKIYKSKREKPLWSRLLCFCINLTNNLALGPVWGFFSGEWLSASVSLSAHMVTFYMLIENSLFVWSCHTGIIIL